MRDSGGEGQIVEADGGKEMRAASAATHSPVVKPYYDEGGVTIYHGRCEDVLPALSERVDLVFTSPPYNLGTTTGGGFGNGRGNMGGKWRTDKLNRTGAKYDDHVDAMPPVEYTNWLRVVLGLCWERLTENGAIFLNHKPRIQASTLWLPLELNPGLPVRQIVIWARSGGINFAPTHYVPTHEWLVILAKSGWRLKSKAASGLGDVWYVTQEASDHPAPFPLGLPARAIESVAPRSVLDPFMGSGTTLRAAKDAGIRGIGIESSERWCDFAARRLAQEVLAVGDAA